MRRFLLVILVLGSPCVTLAVDDPAAGIPVAKRIAIWDEYGHLMRDTYASPCRSEQRMVGRAAIIQRHGITDTQLDYIIGMPRDQISPELRPMRKIPREIVEEMETRKHQPGPAETPYRRPTQKIDRYCIGCMDKNYIVKAMRYASDGDREAASRSLLAGVELGICCEFHPGDEIYIESGLHGLSYCSFFPMSFSRAPMTTSRILRPRSPE